MTLTLWIITAGSVATLLLAIAAFWVIYQNYRFRKQDRRRECVERAAGELYTWAKEGLRRVYLTGSENRDERVKDGLSGLIMQNVAVMTAATIVGAEFVGLTRRTQIALSDFYSAILAKIEKGETPKKEVWLEFEGCFHSLAFYLDVLRIWDHNYNAFIKDARSQGKLPLSQHIRPAIY